MRDPFASKLIAEIAPSMGIAVELEPEYQFAGEINFPNGRRHIFRNTNFNINPAGSTEIARDKGYTCYFLRKHGFHVPNNRAFYSDELNAHLAPERRRGVEEAVDYAYELGYPVYIKPNDLSQGAFVTKAYEAAEIRTTAQSIFARSRVLLIEQFCAGRDYRVVVLGDKVISAYERVPLAIVGDGVQSIDELLTQAQHQLGTLGRPNSEIDPSDQRIDLKLKRLKATRASVLPAGKQVYLLDNANLSTGGSSIDVTESIHPTFAQIAIAATRTLGLRFAGVDLICDNLAELESTQHWNIIEMNAAAGLDNYAAIGELQRERVKDLYRRILLYLEQHDL